MRGSLHVALQQGPGQTAKCHAPCTMMRSKASAEDDWTTIAYGSRPKSKNTAGPPLPAGASTTSRPTSTVPLLAHPAALSVMLSAHGNT